jgi:broad specificity phosphatase PhoE
VEGVANWLWEKARAMRAGLYPETDVYIVTHGMFIDILLKTLFNAPRTTGKQSSLFCSQNACVHKLHFDVAEDGECVGLQMFNDVTHLKESERSGGSVAGLDVAYTHEGSA